MSHTQLFSRSFIFLFSIFFFLFFFFFSLSNSPTAKAGATVRMEGWMLMRTQTRVLLVAVQDPGLLDHLSYSPVSPAQLVDPLQLPSAAGGFGNGMSGGAEDDDSSSDDEEEMAIEQKRAMKKAMKDLKKENKGK